MIELPDIIPISVAVAVLIFVVKETTELIRRARMDGRKTLAICRLILPECRAAIVIARDMELGCAAVVSEARIPMLDPSEGVPSIWSQRGFFVTSYRLIVAERVHLQRFLFDAAAVSPRLFEKAEAAFQALATMDRIRLDMIKEAEEEKAIGSVRKSYWENWADHIREVAAALRALETYCVARLGEFPVQEPPRAW